MRLDLPAGLLALLTLPAAIGKKKFTKAAEPVKERPHIVLIVADDLGWNEVSWNNPHFLTPHMEELSREKGVRLAQSYVTPKCSPSRAALMTGLYPWRIGRQRGAVERFQATGLNTSLPTLPELLAKGGYRTHMVGKWHLGYCRPSMLPTARGFATFYGQYSHVIDYYKRNFSYVGPLGEEGQGRDLHQGEEGQGEAPVTEGDGEFAPDMYTRKAVEVIASHPSSSPLFLYLAYQAPHMMIQTPPSTYTSQYAGRPVYQAGLPEADQQARYRAAAVTAMDQGIGSVVAALKSAGLYNNSIIVFTTDNGGVSAASNHPLRGAKESLYEGGVRGVAWVHSPHINRPRATNNQKMYLTDWLATLLSVAGLGSLLPPSTDSLNMWPTISWGRDSPREEIVLGLDQDTYWNLWSAAIIRGKWKLLWGQDLLLKQRLEEQACNLQLYNLKTDPGETTNLLESSARRAVVAPLRARLMELFREMVEGDYPDRRVVAASDPARHGGHLATGWC